MAIPNPIFDHNQVLPPHTGNPAEPADVSPYPCTTVELVQAFGTTEPRREILRKLMDFREQLNGIGLHQGFQWLDGSFLEDVETREGRPPNDLDVVTVYWGYDHEFMTNLAQSFPAFLSPRVSKEQFMLDHYNFDAGFQPLFTVENTRYWIQLFSHNRLGVWKGMLQLPLNTPEDDANARICLEGGTV